MELIPGKKCIYNDITDINHVIEFIRPSNETYTLLIKKENGKELWVIKKQLSVIDI